MRLLIISDLFPNKVQPERGTFVKLQAEKLSEFYKVDVVSPVPFSFKKYIDIPKLVKGKKCNIFYPREIKLPFNFLFFSRALTYFIAIFLFFISYKKKNKIDLIHCHFAFPDGFVCALLKKIFKIPYVLTVHGSDIRVFPYKNFILKKFVNIALKNANKIIAVSNELKNRVLQLNGKYEVEVIYNGVDFEKFTLTDKKGTEPLNKKIIFLGIFIERKNPLILIESLKNIILTEPNIELHLFGTGHLKQKMIDTIKSYKLENYVKIFDKIDNNRAPEIMKEYDMLVLPSLYESFGVVLIEAMACGLPVVSTKAGGIPEVVNDKKVGLLVEPANQSALEEAILKALKTDWNKFYIREYARKFSIENCINKLCKIYIIMKEKSLQNRYDDDEKKNTDSIDLSYIDRIMKV